MMFTSWEVRPAPDVDLLADEIVREFLAMGADLDEAADVVSRTRYLGEPEVSSCDPPETPPARLRTPKSRLSVATLR
jgi:hypothetical protein